MSLGPLGSLAFDRSLRQIPRSKDLSPRFRDLIFEEAKLTRILKQLLPLLTETLEVFSVSFQPPWP